MDLRETKHSSAKEDQDAKSRQRVLGFVSKVGCYEVVTRCAVRLLILNLLHTKEMPLPAAQPQSCHNHKNLRQKYYFCLYLKYRKKEYNTVYCAALTGHSFLLLKVSRTALTWITQKATAEPQPCERCSHSLGEESREQIKVYHGKQSVLLSLLEYVIPISQDVFPSSRTGPVMLVGLQCLTHLAKTCI